MMLAEELDRAAFVRHFEPEHRRKLANLARLQEYQAGDRIFTEGDHCPAVYVILEGEVGLTIRVPGCGMVEVHQVGPGGLVGWSPVLGGGPMTATAEALSLCRLAALDADQIATLAARDARFGLEFFRCLSAALAERLHSTRMHIPESSRDKFRALREAAD